MTRRHFISGTAGAVALACARPPVTAESRTAANVTRSLLGVENRIGGRLGVMAVDTQTRRQVAHRADERFAMCSTFKWILAADVLAHADRSELALDERVAFSSADLLEYAPVAEQHVAQGSLSIEVLAQAAVTVSDNTAANLLLAKLGGPAGFTQFVRSLGDRTTRLDRLEPMLNTNHPGDARDTTSPRAMVQLMNRLLCEHTLAAASRERLLRWLRASKTGKERIRAGLPSDWSAGDKTGTGMNGACHDVAIAWPPGRLPVLIAVYVDGGDATLDARQAAHAEVGSIVARNV